MADEQLSAVPTPQLTELQQITVEAATAKRSLTTALNRELPNTASVHKLEAGAAIAAGTATLLGLTAERLHHMSKVTREKTGIVMGNYVSLLAQEHQPEPHPIQRYDDITASTEITVHASEAGMVSLVYSYLREQEIAQKDPAAVTIADKLITQAYNGSDDELRSSLEAIIVSSWRQILREETAEMADSLMGDHKIHHAANALHDAITQRTPLSEEALGHVIHGLGIAEEHLAKVLPVLGTADEQLREVVDQLRDHAKAMKDDLDETIDDYLQDFPHFTEVDPREMGGYIKGLLTGSPEFRGLKPKDVSNILVALATRIIQRFPQQILGTQQPSQESFQLIRALSEITAVFDGNQNQDLSLLRQNGKIKINQPETLEPASNPTDSARR